MKSKATETSINTNERVYSDCQQCDNLERKGFINCCKADNELFPNKPDCVRYVGPPLTKDMANQSWKINEEANAKAETEVKKVIINTDEIIYSDCKKCSHLGRTDSGNRCGLSNERFPNKKECEQYNGPEVPKHMASQIWRKNEMANARADTKARTIIINTVHSNCQKCSRLVRTGSDIRCRYHNIPFPNRKRCPQYNGPRIKKKSANRAWKSNCDCQQCSHFNAKKVTCKCYDNFLPTRQRCAMYDGPTIENKG